MKLKVTLTMAALVLGVIIAPFLAVAFPFLFAAFVWNEVDGRGEA